MEQCENMYVNRNEVNSVSKAVFSSTCMNTFNQEDHAPIPKSQIRQTASQESDRFSFCKRVMGLLLAVLLVCLIALTVKYRAETMKLQTDYYKCIDDKNNFSRRYDNLSVERDNLQNRDKAQSKKIQQLEKLTSKIGCLAGWRNFSNHLYCASTKMLTWTESRDSCMDKGAYLVIISSTEEQEFVTNLKTNAWIGLTDSQTEGVWKWLDNTIPMHEYWMAGEPNNSDGNEDCVEMIINMASQQNWNDVSCDKRSNYICEFGY